MMGTTHIAWSLAGWTTASLVLPSDVAATWLGVGTIPAALCSAWVLSPDVDRLWSPGIGGLNQWNRHRGFTHRFWFAWALTAVAAFLTATSDPTQGQVIAATGALWGWWSHLTGDMIFGRLRVHGQMIGLGLRVGKTTEAVFAAVLAVVPIAAVVTRVGY